ncbi:pitrilysin family protein [Macrococcus capreoli]|uniref:M16 family metallopeptidase n=1 Tax=Macrococcus capreoli TaxID=2982690 RepID=UPI0021D58475|nr:pitrilysin family protein [Macrococcus sp. TMW 2.2395]MCU7556514.1 insulinase family protein [Macrococcus sp. TMW 2.2395]
MEQKILDNQLTVVHHTTPMQIVHIAMYVKVGTADEGHFPNGIAHFIEHMVFKGTKHYPFKTLSEAIDAIGGEVNAYTTKTYTCYSIKTLQRFEQKAIDILKEMVFHATFDADELEKERQVILEEIKMIEDDDEENAFERFESLLYQQSPYHSPILGTETSVNTISKQDCIDFYTRYYHPENMILSYVGNHVFDVFNAFSEVEQKSHEVTHHSFSLIPCHLKQYKAGLEQAHVILAHPAVSYKDDKHPVFEIINSLYGGAMTSLLFRKLREEKGLCYSLYSSIDSYQSGGVLYTYFATDVENVAACLSIIDEIHHTLTEGIDEQLLNKTKQYLITNLHMNLDYDGAILEHMGKSMLLYDKIINIASIEAQINAVSLNDVNDVLQIFAHTTASYQLLPQ